MKKSPTDGPPRPDYAMYSAAGAMIPLKGVSIEALVRGVAVHTTVSQRFHNTEDSTVEALYSFPLEERSTVCGFEVLIGGRRIRGAVEEREKAFERYDEAMAAGDSAFLLDQNRSDIFSVSVGRLLPGEEAVVRISYIARTQRYDKGLRLRIPTTISPRYIPQEVAASMDPAELDAILPPTVAGGVPYGLSLSVDIVAESAIRSISCPSFPVQVSIRGRKAKAGLAGRERQLDQDFVLEIELEEPGKAGATACRDEDGYALLLRFKPVLQETVQEPRDVVFVVDRSGSMAGESITEARAALLLGLKSLREGDRFNVAGFGSSMVKVFPGPVDYNQENLDSALSAVGGWDANLGGTEILAPLKDVLGKPVRDRMLDVILLTDGEVGNEADVITLAGRHRSHARIFSFGIGRGASGTLIRGVAEASGGMAEFIFPGERIEPKVMRQMARMSAPTASGARLDWGGLEPEVFVPEWLPAFCSGDEMDIFCRVPRMVATRVGLISASGMLLAECPVDGETVVSDDRTTALLLARELIGRIETGGSPGGSAQKARSSRAGVDRVLEIAMKYGLVSSRTSYVAVEERQGSEKGGEVSLRRVPVALTRGWGGFSLPLGEPMRLMSCSPVKSLSRRGLAKMPVQDSIVCCEAPRLESARVPDRLLELVGMQNAMGYWSLTSGLLALAGSADGKSLPGASPELLGEPGRLATLAALFLLWTEFSEREDEWRLIADKALAWLRKHSVEPSPPRKGMTLAAWLEAI